VPIPDWKCTFTLFDISTEDDGEGLAINLFRPEKDMPQPNAGDVMIVQSAKVQERYGLSLLSNWKTIVYTYSATKIPPPPKSALIALEPPPGGGNRRKPAEKENEDVSWLYHTINKGFVPSETEYQMQSERSLNIKDKFSTLKDVQDSRFYDVIVQVVKAPFDEMDKVGFWVSDYTENDTFYLYSWNAPGASKGSRGDPYGYTSKRNESSSKWAGPFGKRSMQITCWEPHATFVNENVSMGDWIRLRNLHVRYGHNSHNLEGALHEDRNAFKGRIQVELMDTTDPENVDDRLKEAIRRKRNYEKSKKQQQKSYAANVKAKISP
jgi:protection of telomeres protein 1